MAVKLATVRAVPAERVKPAAAKPVPSPARAQRRAVSTAARRQLASTGVSLSHLARGIDAVSHVGALDAWATALAIDAGFIALETAAICATGHTAAVVQRWARPAVTVMMLLSAVLNALAYAEHATPGVDAWVSAVVGMTLPGLIYVPTRVCFANLTGRGD